MRCIKCIRLKQTKIEAARQLTLGTKFCSGDFRSSPVFMEHYRTKREDGAGIHFPLIPFSARPAQPVRQNFNGGGAVWFCRAADAASFGILFKTGFLIKRLAYFSDCKH